MGAAAMLASLSPNFAWAQQVPRDDRRIQGGLHDIRYQMYIYPGTQHGFHNDTTPRYDEKAAKLAWSRTLDFFDLHLRS